MSEDEWTIGKLLEWTKDYLAKSGSESPRLDAEVLLAHAKKCKRIELYTTFDEVADESVRTTFRNLVRQRAEGTPVAYLVESREFYSLPFFVNSAVLIPRPETEFLVIRLLDLAKTRDKKELSIVDVGTGSGVIAICAAIYLPESRIVAVDASQEALEVAKANAITHGVADRIEFVNGDLLGGVSNRAPFDFILSNPPYVSESEYAELDVQVKDHEPRLALVAGPTGTEVIERLIPQAADMLETGGSLIMEISPMIHAAVIELLASDERFGPSHTTQDLAKHPRIVDASRIGKVPTST